MCIRDSGRSNPTAIRHAIRVAKQAIEQDIITKIQSVTELASEAEPVAAVESAAL